MSYFGTKLGQLLTTKDMSQSDLARLTGISQAHISRMVSGAHPTVAVDDLEKICLNISQIPDERAELIRSHLLDECRGPGSEMIIISIAGGDSMTLNDAPAPLSLGIERAFDLLRKNVGKNKDLRDILLSLANLCEDEFIPVETASRKELEPIVVSPPTVSSKTKVAGGKILALGARKIARDNAS